MSLPVPLPLLVVGLLALVAASGAVYWSRTHATADADEDTDESNESGDETGPTAREQLDAALATAREWLDRHRVGLRLGGALVAVGAVLIAFVAVAWLGWGALAGVLFVGGLVAGAAAPPVAILMFRDGLPGGGLVGTGLAIAAQVAFGKAGLVRRDDGQYEWGVLREAEGGYYVELDRGDRVGIAADDGELFSFGFGQLAVTEQHGSNLDRFRVEEGATDTRAGVDVEAPKQQHANSILVSLAKIQRVVRGSASSTLVRRGRDKALDDAGGTGQLSTLWTMAFAAALLVVGFGMTAGVLLL
ncbi:hypothetical protein AFNJKBDN_CDS0006 [Halorubrum virus V_ICIS4]|nr:hypothetical protein AFNJKBDN_CDS0006 [Halorubrum virus V_ICIS4]